LKEFIRTDKSAKSRLLPDDGLIVRYRQPEVGFEYIIQRFPEARFWVTPGWPEILIASFFLIGEGPVFHRSNYQVFHSVKA
jgi:hypothetical protein